VSGFSVFNTNAKFTFAEFPIKALKSLKEKSLTCPITSAQQPLAVLW